MELLGAIIIGAAAGWLAGRIMKSKSEGVVFLEDGSFNLSALVVKTHLGSHPSLPEQLVLPS